MTNQRVTIMGPNLFGAPETFHVHSEGCRDLRKPLYRRVRPEAWTIEAASERDVIEEVYSDIMAENEGEWATWEPYQSEFRFFPCVTLPSEEVVTS